MRRAVSTRKRAPVMPLRDPAIGSGSAAAEALAGLSQSNYLGRVRAFPADVTFGTSVYHERYDALFVLGRDGRWYRIEGGADLIFM